MSGPRDATTVGVVGDHPAVAQTIADAGGDPRTGPASDVLSTEPDLVVAVGESALLEVVRADASIPTLPVDAGRALRSISREALDDATDRLLAGTFETVEYPVLEVASPLGATRVLMDAMLVTAEPARISEYRVWTGDEQVARFRADGVAVTTPAGSQGYARACDGPVTKPDTGVVAVVPVAPFATDEDVWVLPHDAVELVVERDETPVELLADDRSVGSVGPGESVRLGADGTLPIAVLPESRSFFE